MRGLSGGLYVKTLPRFHCESGYKSNGDWFMQKKCNLTIFALIFLSFFAVFAMQQAQAQLVDSPPLVQTLQPGIPVTPSSPGNPPDSTLVPQETVTLESSVNDPHCPSGNAADSIYYNNSAGHLQRAMNVIQNINNANPVQAAMTTCVLNVMKVIQSLTTMVDNQNLFGTIADAILSSIIVSLINQVCSQVTSLINQAKTALINLTKICIPLPHFSLPHFSLTTPSCTGGIVFSPLQWTPNPPLVPMSNANQYIGTGQTKGN